MKKLNVFIIVGMVLFLVTGCVGTKNSYVPNWNYLHRVGPKTKVRVYYYSAEDNKWYLSDDKVEVPEGYYISPPPDERE